VTQLQPGFRQKPGLSKRLIVRKRLEHFSEEREMQNLLVTGGAGFIGCNFVRYMLDKYPTYNIVVYDKLTYAGRLENLQDIQVSHGSRLRFVRGDICDASAVDGALRAYKIDTIVNFAAETHVDRSIMNPDAFIQTDVYGVYVLLEAARKAGNLRYHQISTDEVYGHIHGDHRSLESDCMTPRSPYAASKASGDHMVNAYHITYGLPVTISRGANNIGPFQYPEKVVPLFVTNALSDISLPVYGDGKQMRDYQHVMDHCAGIDAVLHAGEIGESYNIGTGKEMTNLEMVQILLDELGKPIQVGGTPPSIEIEAASESRLEPTAGASRSVHLSGLRLSASELIHWRRRRTNPPPS
jgi:dTDP-glucose 4,6-dehydratase